MKIIKMSPRLHNFFVKAVLQHKIHKKKGVPAADVYMLGEDGEGIVIKAVKITKGRHYSNYQKYGCKEMAAIPRQTMIKSVMKIYKDNLIPSGLARIGLFDAKSVVVDMGRGAALSQLKEMSKDAYLLSFERRHTQAEKLGEKLEYAVVKPRGVHVKKYSESIA